MVAYPLFSRFMQAEDINGVPLSGGKLFFYLPGTTTTFTVYQNATGATPHANPVVADASGIFAAIYVPRATYKIVLKDSADVTVLTVDPVDGNNSAFIADNNGSLVTAGTAAAYTVATNQGLGTAANGNSIRVRAHTTNTQGATINLDGGGAVAIKVETFAGDFAIGAGAMTVGGIYDLSYSSVEAAYMLMNPSSGEYISSQVLSGAAVALTTATAADVTNIALTPGDWNVSAYVAFTQAATTSVTRVQAGTNTTSATMPTAGGTNGAVTQWSFAAFVGGAGNRYTVPVSTTRINTSGGATGYLVALSTFTVDTQAGYGRIEARRA